MTRIKSWAGAQSTLATPFFDAIRPILRRLPVDRWPDISQLNAIAIADNTHNFAGKPLRFEPADASASSAMAYETRIATTGEIPTRQNWHDIFNALQWLAFPQTKSTISQMHTDLLRNGGTSEARFRSVPRDVLTMFDESGIVVASEDASLLALVRNFQWKTLFVDRREEAAAKLRCLLIGHGLLEKSLSPFIGMTAKAVLLNTDRNADLDAQVADWLGNSRNLVSARNLAPLPVLGIPGWDSRNTAPSFYDNTGYFRAGYTRDQAAQHLPA